MTEKSLCSTDCTHGTGHTYGTGCMGCTDKGNAICQKLKLVGV